MASVDRGKAIYKEYCSQCHGATGKGDGPAASGLVPKPAIHANIPFETLPPEYLYNVINHGSPAVGKSPNMPYWNLTVGQQGVADVIAYLRATFKRTISRQHVWNACVTCCIFYLIEERKNHRLGCYPTRT